ncbi:MAG: hypothetical protein AAFO62_12440, partial [Pseudomonadota bacterium]
CHDALLTSREVNSASWQGLCHVSLSRNVLICSAFSERLGRSAGDFMHEFQARCPVLMHAANLGERAVAVASRKSTAQPTSPSVMKPSAVRLLG